MSGQSLASCSSEIGRRAVSALGCVALVGAATIVAAPPAGAATAPPAIRSVTPATGRTAGGTRVTITGLRFTRVTAVRFGTVSGSAVRVVSATRLVVTAPRHAAGAVNVRVVTGHGVSPVTAADAFRYIPPPRVTGISPTSGPASGGTGVTVLGSTFRRVTSVRFGTTSGTGLRVLSSTRLVITAPAHTVGSVPVRVFTAYGSSPGVAAGQFTYHGTTPSPSPSPSPSTSPAPSPAPSVTPSPSSSPSPSPSPPGALLLGGSYSGSDTANRVVALFVSSAGTALQDISVYTTDLTCAPASSANDRIQIASIPVASDGSFSSTTSSTGVFAGHAAKFTYVFRGNPTSLASDGSPRLTGTLRETVDNTDTPARTCTTNDLSWTVTRDTQPAQPTTPPPAGSYSGSDVANRPLSFFVSSDGGTLQDISLSATDLSCLPDGTGANSRLQIASVPIGSDGSFDSTTTSSGVFAGHPATFTYRLLGNVHGLNPSGLPRLAGIVRQNIEYTDLPARTCTTNDLYWLALRDTQPAQPAGAPLAGSYAGSDTANRVVTLTVAPAGDVLQNVSVPVTDLGCVPDGGGVNDHLQVASVPVNSDGAFDSTTTQTGVFAGHPATFTYVFRGNAHGLSPSGAGRLAGTLRETIQYTDSPARTCTTNDLYWSALHT